MTWVCGILVSRVFQSGAVRLYGANDRGSAILYAKEVHCCESKIG